MITYWSLEDSSLKTSSQSSLSECGLLTPPEDILVQTAPGFMSVGYELQGIEILCLGSIFSTNFHKITTKQATWYQQLRNLFFSRHLRNWFGSVARVQTHARRTYWSRVSRCIQGKARAERTSTMTHQPRCDDNNCQRPTSRHATQHTPNPHHVHTHPPLWLSYMESPKGQRTNMQTPTLFPSSFLLLPCSHDRGRISFFAIERN